jgi:hypothetical protein
MLVTETKTLTATVFPTNANQDVVWASSNTGVATVSETGTVTANAIGTATITVRSTVDSTKTDECEVTVMPRAGLYHTSINGAHKIGPQNLTNALVYISSNASNDASYFIVLGADEAVTPKTLNYSASSVHITLAGEGSRIISLNGNGSLFTIQAVHLTLDNNITLKGNSSNTASLVRIVSGTLNIKSGAKISDNITSGDGGGVYVVGGSLLMEGGEINGNTASNGGGVYIDGGHFDMKAGEIKGNTASRGGGVMVRDDSTNIGRFFRKSGGIIYGDTNTTHTGNTENTAGTGWGHAVSIGNSLVRRNSTAGTEINLYYWRGASTYSHNDTSEGGVGDTTANWQ